MKIINLGRCQGKTIRLLYASEWQNIPILCANHCQKEYLKEKARDLGLKIPEPITPSSLARGKTEHKDILIDEAPLVLQSLLKELGVMGEIKAITLTSDELEQGKKYDCK